MTVLERVKVLPIAQPGTGGSVSYLRSALGETPWEIQDVPKLAVRVAVGAGAVVVSWLGVSGTGTFRDQLVWAAVGVGGVAVAVLGGVVWLLAGLARLRAERRYLKATLIARAASARIAAGPMDADHRVATASMRHFHRPSCQLARHKDVAQVDPRSARRRGLVACQICHAEWMADPNGSTT